MILVYKNPKNLPTAVFVGSFQIASLLPPLVWQRSSV
jgi:hypothetical protein